MNPQTYNNDLTRAVDSIIESPSTGPLESQVSFDWDDELKGSISIDYEFKLGERMGRESFPYGQERSIKSRSSM